MLSKERSIYIVIIVILLGIIGYGVFGGNDIDYIKDYEYQIFILEKEKSLLLLRSDSLEAINKGFIKKIDTLNSDLLAKDIELSQLKSKTNEEISNIDSLNDVELLEFFSKRYPRHN